MFQLNKLFLKCLFPLLIFSAQIYGLPIITNISPQFGPQAGGTIVTITGSGFSGATAVNFGSQAATTFTVQSDTMITATTPQAVFGNVNSSVTTPTGTSVASQASIYTYQGNWLALVGNESSNDITVINVGNNLPQNIPVGAGIFGIGIPPDGTKAYLLDTVGSTVIPIDLANFAVGAPIPLIPGAFPIDIAITPDGKTAYIADQNINSITPIDVTTNTVLPSFVVPGLGPYALGITPDGKTLYCVDQSSQDVITVDTATNTVTGMPFMVNANPTDIAITPDGKTGYINNFISSNITVFDVSMNVITGTIPISGPYGIAITPDGTKAYVSNFNNNTVTVLDLATNTIIGAPIAVGAGPLFLAITPDGKFVYVPNSNDNTVSVIDTATNTVIATIPSGINPRNVAITPDQAPVARFNASSSNLSITLDASGSVSPVGTIASYAWDFGDGTTAVTNVPFISHTYANPGNYIVTLSVVNSAGTSIFQLYTTWIVSRQGGPTAIFRQGINLGLFPPSSFTGKVIKNKFLNFTDYVHHLTWTPSPSPTIIAYLLFRNNLLIAEIPATGPFFYNDHDREKHERDIYILVAIDATGQKSQPLITIVPSK